MEIFEFIRKEYYVVDQEIEQDSLMLLNLYAGKGKVQRSLNGGYQSALIEKMITRGFLEREDPLSQARITEKGKDAVERGWVYNSQWTNK